MGVARTDPRYQGQYFAQIAAFLLAEKIAKEFGIDAYAQIMNGNKRPQIGVKRNDLDIIDTFSFISVDNKNGTFPCYGHL